MFETDIWPFTKARWFTESTDRRKVRVIVIHDMEFSERTDTAEVIAKDFANRKEDNKASAHLCIDSNSIVQCVLDNDVAYAAPGCNSDGLHIELAGYGKQTREQWLDPFGIAMLALGADAAAQYCLKYDIPPLKLTDEQLFAGQKGIVGHDQVSRVYKKSDHTDPGPNFPWDYFINHVVSAFQSRSP
jgi:N-acetyl-anhydromuramyl-L-alanine amidase AmpD